MGLAVGGAAPASCANACTNSSCEESAYFKLSSCFLCHGSRGRLGMIMMLLHLLRVFLVCSLDVAGALQFDESAKRPINLEFLNRLN